MDPELTRWTHPLACSSPILPSAGACHLCEEAACYLSSSVPVSPACCYLGSMFPKCNEFSSLPAGQAEPKKSDKQFSVQIVPTLGMFLNFQTEAVLGRGRGGGKKLKKKCLAFQHFSWIGSSIFMQSLWFNY